MSKPTVIRTEIRRVPGRAALAGRRPWQIFPAVGPGSRLSSGVGGTSLCRIPSRAQVTGDVPSALIVFDAVDLSDFAVRGTRHGSTVSALPVADVRGRGTQRKLSRLFAASLGRDVVDTAAISSPTACSFLLLADLRRGGDVSADSVAPGSI